MACYGEYYQPVNVSTTCCEAVLANPQIDIREITSSVIYGTVTCAADNSTLYYPLVVARNTTTNEVFYAICSITGTYEILVTPGNYEVAAFANCGWYNSTPVACNSCSSC